MIRNRYSAPVVGLALFTMFFGSGNLIFPLAVGQTVEGAYPYGILGFLLTGVLVPFAGLLVMVLYDGLYTKFFSCLGKTGGFLAAFVLLTFWIPLGSGPRCIVLAYANAKHYLPEEISLWVFSLIYSLITLLLVLKRSWIMDILGKVLTPILLVLLGMIIVKGFMTAGDEVLVMPVTSGEAFQFGLLEGYNTMDLIASFFFATVVVHLLRDAEKEGKLEKPLNLLLRASVFGMAVLGIVYIGLIAVAALHAPFLRETVVSNDFLLPTLTHHVIPQFAVISTFAVVLACLTTSMALLMVYAEFLEEVVFRNKVSNLSMLLLTSAIIFGMSILGFKGIMSISGPAFQIFYPCLILLLFINGIRKLRERKKTSPA